MIRPNSIRFLCNLGPGLQSHTVSWRHAYVFRTMFSTLSKGDHSQKKRHIAGQYANTNIMRSQVMGGIQDHADAFIKRCDEHAGKSIDAYVILHCFALDCATHHFFDPYGTHSIENKEDFKLVQELSYHNSLQLFLAQYYCSSLVNIMLKATRARPAPLSREYVFKTCGKTDPGEYTLLYKLQNSKEYFQPVEIAAECMDHMAAGIDTTGDALCFLMYQISLPVNSSVQEKLFQEFEENKDKPLDDLKYLDAVVKEALRCFPPIPMSQPRYVPKGGRTIDGYYIPESTIVSCQAYSVHRLNEKVYSDGDTFLPERWLDMERSIDMNKLFFSFGTGARGCTGKHLAMAEMKCLLREVYSRFRTKIASDMTGRMDISDQIISSRPLDQTCKLKFERRS